MLNLIPESQKSSIRKKKATQKFMLHEEMLHCRGQEKNKQVYVKECKCVVPTET